MLLIRKVIIKTKHSLMNKRPFLLLLFVQLLFSQIVFCQQSITLHSLLTDMTDFDAVAKWPTTAYTLKQASSYDRRSVSRDKPGWFANGDFNQFIREEKNNGRTEYVMMDVDGPGAIVRFWLTTVVKPGMLRFYFDNEQKAAIEVPAFDLMKAGFNIGPALLNPHSSYEPQGKGGNTLYLPLPYQKHCKVTWEYTDTSAMRTAHYYQINYMTYPPGTKVKTFAMSDLAAEKELTSKTEAALWNPHTQESKVIKLAKQLSAGKEAVIDLPTGANAIRQFAFQLSTANKADYEKAWRVVILKIEFDGAQTVWCPLGDFIGSGYGGKKIKSWYRELNENGQGVSRWVMPYEKKARITFINNADFDVNIIATVTVNPFHWDRNTMYFHTTYKYEANVKDVKGDYDLNKVAKLDTAGPIDWNFATIKGRGVYLGNTFSVYNHMNAWYGEGDAKAYVDNEAFPSEFGTGLEDYYNTSWAPVVLYQTPFANAPRADSASSTGFNTFTRTRILDRIPFTKAFSFDMEMLSWTGGTINAAATTYWYGSKGATDTAQNK
jgi:hypothetical protein